MKKNIKNNNYPKRHFQADTMCIGQLYCYLLCNNKLEKGYLKKITEKDATFEISSRMGYKYNITFLDGFGHSRQHNYIFDYNASFFNKYNKLVEQQKKEREALLNGDFVPVKEIIFEKAKTKLLEIIFKKGK